MPLEYLALLVGVSLALVIAIVHISGGKRAGSLDAEQVRRIWAYEMKEEAPSGIVVSDDRETAFLLGEKGCVGLVRQMGAHYVARQIAPQAIARVDTVGEHVLIRFRDTTLRRLKAPIGESMKRQMIVQSLEAIREKDHA